LARRGEFDHLPTIRQRRLIPLGRPSVITSGRASAVQVSGVFAYPNRYHSLDKSKVGSCIGLSIPSNSDIAEDLSFHWPMNSELVAKPVAGDVEAWPRASAGRESRTRMRSQRISAAPTKLYDPTSDEITLDEVERIAI
jgi:hypothetical protein